MTSFRSCAAAGTIGKSVTPPIGKIGTIGKIMTIGKSRAIGKKMAATTAGGMMAATKRGREKQKIKKQPR